MAVGYALEWSCGSWTLKKIWRSIIVLHSACICSFLIVIITFTSFIYRFVSIHRLKSVSDFVAASKFISTSTTGQCISLNSTHYRCLPNVFLIGASKCGTTSLIAFLKKRPNVHLVKRGIHATDAHSEVHRFDRSSYVYVNKHFELAHEWASSPVVESPNSSVIIHYTPHYLYAPSVPFELRSFYPHADKLKLIIVLRDPVERAISSYWFKNSHLFHDYDRGNLDDLVQQFYREMQTRESFEKCIVQKMESGQSIDSDLHASYLNHLRNLYTTISTEIILEPENKSTRNLSHWSTTSFCSISKKVRRPTNFTEAYFKGLQQCFGKDFRSPSLGLRHLDKGIYVDQLLRWLMNFDRSQFLIITSEQLRLDPAATIDEIMKFTVGGKAKRQDKTIDFKGKNRLVRPNKLAEIASNKLNASMMELYRKYYDDYDGALFSLLSCRGMPSDQRHGERLKNVFK